MLTPLSTITTTHKFPSLEGSPWLWSTASLLEGGPLSPSSGLDAGSAVGSSDGSKEGPGVAEGGRGPGLDEGGGVVEGGGGSTHSWRSSSSLAPLQVVGIKIDEKVVR